MAPRGHWPPNLVGEQAQASDGQADRVIKSCIHYWSCQAEPSVCAGDDRKVPVEVNSSSQLDLITGRPWTGLPLQPCAKGGQSQGDSVTVALPNPINLTSLDSQRDRDLESRLMVTCVES